MNSALLYVGYDIICSRNPNYRRFLERLGKWRMISINFWIIGNATKKVNLILRVRRQTCAFLSILSNVCASEKTPMRISTCKALLNRCSQKNSGARKLNCLFLLM